MTAFDGIMAADVAVDESESFPTAPSRRQSVSHIATSLLSTYDSISSAVSSYCEPSISYPAPRGSPRRPRHGPQAVHGARDRSDSTLRARPKLHRKRSHSDGALLASYDFDEPISPMRQEHIVTGGLGFDDFGSLPSLTRWRSNGSSAASDVSSAKSVTFSDAESSGYASSDASAPRPSRSDLPRRRSCLHPSSPVILGPVPPGGSPRRRMRNSFNNFEHHESVDTVQPRLRQLQASVPHSRSSHQLLTPHLRSQSHPIQRSPSPCPSLSSSSDLSAASSPVNTPDIEPIAVFPSFGRSDSFKPSSPRRQRTYAGGSSARNSRRLSEADLVPNGRKTFLGDFGVYVEEEDAIDDASFFAEGDYTDPEGAGDETISELTHDQVVAATTDVVQGSWLPRIGISSFGLKHAWRYFVSPPAPAAIASNTLPAPSGPTTTKA